MKRTLTYLNAAGALALAAENKRGADEGGPCILHIDDPSAHS